MRADLTVVKLGGSYARSRQLEDWLRALSACAGRVVLVPGGGPFADAVRRAQQQMGFDDQAAHRMALLAMEQYGCALASLDAGMTLAGSGAAIRRAARERRVPVWSPTRMVEAAEDIPWSWDVTADSLAAWLAQQLGARCVLLVKQVAIAGAPCADRLVAEGVIDPLFPRFLAASGAKAAIAGPDDHAAAARAIQSGTMPGVAIELAAPP
jgi:aspartokinase-like uncharacterized kinase